MPARPGEAIASMGLELLDLPTGTRLELGRQALAAFEMPALAAFEMPALAGAPGRSGAPE